LREALGDPDAAVRYWAATALAALGPAAHPAREELRGALGDSSVPVRCAAAEALCRLGEDEKALPVLIEALGQPDGRAALQAAIVLASLGNKARPAIAALEAAAARGGEPAEHFRYVGWALNAVRESAG
jgi:HEAT repeat protein